MTNEELVIAYQKGDQKSLSELCRLNYGLVKKVAKNFSGESEDLIQDGMVGLVKAASLFDPEKGAKFSTYAFNWIFAQCSSCSKRMNGIVNVNGRQGNLALGLLKKVTSHLSMELGREPSIEEIAAEMKIEESIIQSIIGISGKSFNSPIGDENDSLLSDVIADTSPRPDEISESLSMQSAVRNFSKTLENEIHKYVFLNLNSLSGDMTNEQIGKKLGVSRQRVSQIGLSIRPKFESYARRLDLDKV